jgi:hypothetical protein
LKKLITSKNHISQYFPHELKFRVLPRTVFPGNYHWEFPPLVFPGQPWPISIFLFPPKFLKFLRFVWEDRVYTFKTMPFGLSTTPLVFTRIFQAVVANLHSQSIFIHSYLDDSLLKNMSQFLQRDHTHFVIGLLLKLGFLISWKKSEVVPSQDFIFLGEHYRTDMGLVFPPEEKIETLQFLVNKFFQVLSVPARQFLQLIGFLISLMDVIPLGCLHIRPIQWYLREFWHPVTQMWEAYIPVLPRLLPHLQW